MTRPRLAKCTHLVCKLRFKLLHTFDFVSAKDIYAWSKTPLGKIKVVIIGQGKVDFSGGLNDSNLRP